jgi:hypothetical protein
MTSSLVLRWIMMMSMLQSLVLFLHQNELTTSEYTVVYRKPPEIGVEPKTMRIDVSVKRWLNIPEIKQLICRIVAKEDFPSHKMLIVGIWHDYDDYVPDPFGLETAKHYDHSSADYTWNQDLAERLHGGSLSVYRDDNGDRNYTHQYWDHLKCSDSERGED